MAAEVLVLRVAPRHDGGENYTVLAFFEVNPPITVGNNPPILVVPTPADTLPKICDDYNLVPPVYKTKLNAGAVVFEQTSIRRKPGQSAAELVQVIRNRYPAKAAEVVGNYRRLYEQTGTWVDI